LRALPGTVAEIEAVLCAGKVTSYSFSFIVFVLARGKKFLDFETIVDP
jgi:hypothetical protein